MAKALTEIRSIARSHTRTAINVLVGIMRSKDATAAARVSAANAKCLRKLAKFVTSPMADRYEPWVGELQANRRNLNGKDGGCFHRIERVIVHPENSDRESV